MWLPDRPSEPVVDNWPPKPLPIYADFDYERTPMPPEPTDTSPEEPDTGPTDDDASDPEDDPTTAPVVPTTEDPE